MVKLFFVFCLLRLFSGSAAQFLQTGQCDENIQLQNDFEIEEFLGNWYEITRSENPYQDGDCSTIEFTRTSNTTITVQSSAVVRNFFNQVNGTVTYTTGTAKLTLTLPNFSSPVNFWLLSTDYLNFALGYSCVNVGTTQRNVYIWQLGRQSVYPNEMIPALMATTLQNLLGINANELQRIDHGDVACYILPIIEAGQPIILPGQCDANITIVQNFNVTGFTGLWNVIASYETENAQGSCPRAEYTLANNVVNVVNSQVVNQTLDSIFGTAIVNSTDGSARLSVTLEVAPGVNVEQELLILATNYQDYAVSYTCRNLDNNQKRVNSWIISRTRQLSAAVQTQVDQVINSYIDLNNQYYQEARQSDDDCFYYPTPVLNQPVVFRGQCDLNIPAMPNFDPVGYMGIWHDIESYPTSFQDGTCSNAEYTLVDGRVDVYNTQVINQTLDTINGFATVASTDGSAKLLVTFPIAGTNLTIETDYWVLDTDYTTYSLVYSCRNLDSDTRLVTAWKLSRTKSLPAAAENIINNITNSINVLDQRYFVAKDQSRQGCFYFPEPVAGEPVVFPGLCDETISVVQNFNFQQFQGTWHEIEAYPKDQQTGQCVNHQFTATSNTVMNLVSSNIFDQFLGVTNGVVTYNSSDLSAKLTIEITANGSAITIPYWILSTDYTNYALAYSCVNLNDDFRAIYSWKLSRNQTLSAAASTMINNVTADIEVLDNRYYETIDQSDNACFYLPDLAPGEPVVLVGQCDPNIRGIANFSAARYLGVWRLIEGYPSDSQTGTCEEANYSLNANGSVSVLNSEVINQTLVTITGTAVLGSTDGTGQLTVTFPNIPGTFEYYILDTDYDNYALVYGCVNLNNNQRRIWSWKMSRTNNLNLTAVANINQVIDSIEVLNNRFYQTIDRSYNGCFYYPTPSNNAVVFRGQCNESIPVVTSFNAVQYMGLWHDIESYPAAFQDGTCGNANYSLSTTGVDVFNTQVINQTLDTINGVAIVASTDGSAKLLVTFPVGGINITTNYWVLATDYLNYALVYSCVNINEYYKQVSSWKLSRTKELAAASTTAINSAISNIQELDQRYFIQRDQSREGCFYFPEPRAGVPVVFPGECADGISAVQNFNMSLFAGIWHETQTYPKEAKFGQCFNKQLTVSNNIFNLEATNVFNEILDVNTGFITFSNNTSVAELILTINSGSSIVGGVGNSTIPYWIIATDYFNYALAYSCVQLDIDFRAVWSWKLSRTRQLSTSSNASISEAMTPYSVLDERYFETVDQTDEACFYLPNLTSTDPVVFPGQCDLNITTVQNFNASRFLGRWLLIESYPSVFQVGSCNDATYSLAADGSVIVYNTEVVNQQLSTINGSAVVSSTDGSGKLLVTFPGAPPIEYWILDTDYDSYALIYSCVNLDSERRQVWSWKMSRTNTLTQIAVVAINNVVDSINVLNDQYYQTVSRTDDSCFYFPEPSDNAVVFRGQCNESIPVVTNFDAVRYMGLWHDIESYPAAFQDGTCGNANYSLTTAGVDVFNTQVINQTLDTINGVAVLATTDGSAKLLVTFPVGGFNVTTSYWVLATDYDNYALVYSCFNVNNEYRQVSSWKLSRTKALTATSTTAINNVLDTVQVLDQRYYIQKNQTAQGCFHFPEPQVGVPVVFPGQCNENIGVVQNFNLSQFEGLWHEIQAYPKEEQSGQCINHQFTVAANNTLDLRSTNVANLTLDVSNGIVTFDSNDNSARLTITINVNGIDIIIPYSIIATDYTNYALAYSCVNINSDYRGVWSWKLSRTQQLTAASNTAINNAISNIDVIDQRYFEDINQSDNACFYLPDLGPGEAVEFVGQCDPNISVEPNFDAVRFLGRWLLIESYTSAFQLGTCNDATYSLGANGSVDVYNTQVINETLSTINGSAVVASTDGSGKLLVTFPGASIEYWILDTDYTTYSLIYSCSNLTNNRRRVWSWKMSRTNSLTQAAINSIAQTMSQVNVLDDRYFAVVNRSTEACFYYPTPDGNPVVFRGQCDESIPVVTNFNASAYQGQWHDIQSYPSRFQTGTCNNALYSLNNDGTINVFNTQVVEQLLATISGTAVAATDGSAKLNVTFSSTAPYWVLATDYNNYALVYSCQNIDAEYRRVSSWKLSRQRTLSAASITAINNVVNSVQVLRDDYYVTRRQSEEDCFYYPDNFGGDVILEGQCTDYPVDTVTNFNPNSFTGTWHEIARFPSDLQVGECAASEYALASQNSFNVIQIIVRNEIQNNVSISANISTDGRGVLTANLGSTLIDTVYILDTDYTEFALTYGCRNVNTTHKQIFSWKLSRSRDGLSTVANNWIDAVINNTRNLHPKYYRPTGQDYFSCFYYPEFDPNSAFISLPGPCNETITGVPNFNAAAYLGVWNEIERYPQPTQFGQCDRAEYSLGTNVVDVSNTLVLNQTLFTQLGSAVVASTDGSGLLNVTFNVNGVIVVTNYYILATDYTSYALVYSCRNLNNGWRQVGSWKLSRTTSLSTQANEVMNSSISLTQGLLNDYYLPTSQSDEDCFYIPEVDPNRAPLFRGQCEDITGVQGFDIERYLGWWHEIERYPSDNNVGECINSQYQSSNNQIQVIDTSVTGGTGTVTSGTVVVTANNTLVRTLSNGQQQEIAVLATDYDNYALLYSCENVGTEYRRVWSAKHSKTRQLTQAAQNAMASVIEEHQLLYPQFYQTVNQSDSACFYYPELTGSQVILPGQCDDNIPVVQNFDASAYGGTWYQIQKYDQIHESGTCIGARYILNEETGVVDVLNWEVIDGTLVTINGTATVVSSDGSAKLSVILPIVGTNNTVSTSLYVLTSDYESYSLAYSCTNINAFQRSIGAWKLSRTREMSTAGNTAINAYMATREELHQPYFRVVEQNNDCEEPSSALLVKSSIIVILVCALLQMIL